MEFDGVQVSQSMAMARFLSRKAGFEGKSDADFVMYAQDLPPVALLNLTTSSCPKCSWNITATF